MASSSFFSTKLVIKSSEFRLAAFLRLDTLLPFSQIVTKCDCDASLDEHGSHLICKFGWSPVGQHNTIVSTWAKCLDKFN